MGADTQLSYVLNVLYEFLYTCDNMLVYILTFGISSDPDVGGLTFLNLYIFPNLC